MVGEVDGNSLAVATEFKNGDFAAGHIVTGETLHGTYQVLANATHLYGSWMTYSSKRSFKWEMKRGGTMPHHHHHNHTPPTKKNLKRKKRQREAQRVAEILVCSSWTTASVAVLPAAV